MKKLFRISLLFLLVQTAFAQAQTITGTVKNKADGIPIPGVSILIQGTTKGSVTDLDGKYSISASAGQTLVFSYIGFETKVVKITKEQILNVDLSESASQLN